jgi:hypothetical protein
VSAIRVGVLLAMAVAAAVVVNLVLLGVATGDPVGKLSPSPSPGAAILPAPPPPARITVTPPTRRGEHRDRHEDD